MIEKKKKYKLSDFRYQLPKRFIAQKPRPKREKLVNKKRRLSVGALKSLWPLRKKQKSGVENNG